MNKKIFIILAFIIILPIGWWLISPLWRDIELDEKLPAWPMIGDNLDSMDSKTRQDFMTQTEMMKAKVMEMSDAMPANEPRILLRAPMVARAHDVRGEALLVEIGNEHTLRFENLETINGPDLRIYLGADLSAGDIVDLGPIRATKGNVNYPIPPGTDISKYKHAMIWCRAFGVLFGYAQL